MQGAQAHKDFLMKQMIAAVRQERLAAPKTPPKPAELLAWEAKKTSGSNRLDVMGQHDSLM